MPSNDKSLRNQWESGISFSDAAFEFATERERDGIRNAVDQGAWLTRMILVQASLFDEIRAARLIAIGIPEGKDRSVEPEIIPAHLFHSEKWQIEQSIDWPSGVVELAGHRWVQVRVSPPEAGTAASEIRTQPQIAEGQKQRDRPPSVYDLSFELTKELLEAGELKQPKRRQQYQRVRAEARKRHPIRTALHSVSDETLRKVFVALGIIVSDRAKTDT